MRNRFWSSSGWMARVIQAVAVFYLSSAPVFAGVLFGFTWVRPPAYEVASSSVLDAFSRSDGKWYTSIVRDGYVRDVSRRSNIAFFPLYPGIAASVSALTGAGPQWALLIVSNVALIAAILLFQLYVEGRGGPAIREAPAYEVLALALLPPTFFFRMTYSESLLLVAMLAAMLAMARRAPLPLCALLCGAAAGARPVGIALLLPLSLHCWSELRSARLRILKGLALVILGAWGLVAFVAYQAWTFGDPLAFARAHMEQWILRSSRFVGPSKVEALLTLEPIWGSYVPTSPGYWKYAVSDILDPLFALQFANPIYFVAFAVLVVVGFVRRWITLHEALLSAGLLGIPYVTRSYEMCMGSHARFAAVVFPAYIVIGHMLRGLPGTWAALLLVPCVFFLVIYSVLFGAGYWLF